MHATDVLKVKLSMMMEFGIAISVILTFALIVPNDLFILFNLEFFIFVYIITRNLYHSFISDLYHS